MARLNLLLCSAALIGAVAINGSTFKVDVENGSVSVIRKPSMDQLTITDTATISSADSLIVPSGSSAHIQLEDSTLFLCKGPVNCGLNGDNISLKISLDGEGQIFLDRKKPYTMGWIEIVSRGFLFRPIGTSAAVKTTSNGFPSTAVLDGKMNMQSPTGEVLIIEKGSFGAIGPDGKLSSGKLPPNAIESLQQWIDGVRKPGSAAPQTGTQQEVTQQPQPAVQSEPAPAAAGQQVTPAATPAPVTTPPVPAATITSDKAAGDEKIAAPQSDKNEKKRKKNTQQSAAPAGSINQTASTSPQSDDNNSTGSEPTTSAPDKKAEQTNDTKQSSLAGAPATPKWEIGAGLVTVDNEQWTRIALGVDVPLWKFGIFFDLELFIDADGKLSNKGWNFGDDWFDALTRKIRYIRFGQETDPLFVKVGGLSSVTLGYGFLVDRFTNMLHYPDQKLLGLQFNLNDLTPIGLTLQTVVADFKDFRDDGGVLGARLGFKPLKMTQIPIVSGINVAGSYAVDLNQYAPARKWDFTLSPDRWDRDKDYITDSTFYFDKWGQKTYYDSIRSSEIANNDYDTIIEHKDKWASREDDQYGLLGGDISIPLISSKILNLDLYGQAGIRDDGKHGWGIGAPGVALKLAMLWANVEYRRVQGRFTPGYFNTWYLDERIIRNYTDLEGTRISIKEDRIPDDDLNGVFGRLGFNIANVLTIDGSYQYMVGQDRDNTDQRFEITSSIGDLIMQKIPKINRLEAYYTKTEIGNYITKIDITGKKCYDKFFDETPFMYYGYRLGFEITQGASLICDWRFGYKTKSSGKLASNNFLSVQTAIAF
ncbi:MAG TPA: hypothetical protein VHO70_12565 [Chitinispirillaceae bacterium]|nr:hypothetical protein [Chitinispirillaceae bacterium]